MRPNIYIDAELRKPQIPPLVTTLVVVVAVIIVFVVIVFFVCRWLTRVKYTSAKRKDSNAANTPELHSSAFDDNETSNFNAWKKAFGDIVLDNRKGLRNLEALHSVFSLPLDMQFGDPLVNEDLLKDRNRLSRAWERRRMLDEMLGENPYGGKLVS